MKRGGLAAFVTVMMLALASTSAAAELDVRGTWNCCTGSTNPAVGTQTWVITGEDLSTGQWTGWGYGGSYTWPMTGTISGSTMTFNVPYYDELRSYSAHGTGTVSGGSWNTNFTDSNGSSGSFVLAKLAAPPPPVAGKSLNAKRVSGTVLVKLPGTTKFVDLSEAVQLPVGTTVDVTKGSIALTAAQGLSGSKTATAVFSRGVFRIRQKASAKPVTDLKLVGGDFKACSKTAFASPSVWAAASRKVRELWGKGKGIFRTTGRYASATIRGTAWSTQDFCDGTLTRVTQGSVLVRDFVKNKNVVVKAGRSYFARAKR